MTNPKAFGEEAVTLSDAWQLYDEFIRDPRVYFTDEPPDVERHWRAYTQRRTFSPKVWNDAFLAAFAWTANLELAAFDKGFAQYADLKCTILEFEGGRRECVGPAQLSVAINDGCAKCWLGESSSSKRNAALRAVYRAEHPPRFARWCTRKCGGFS